MPSTVAGMTKSELNELIEKAVEEKLLELLGDPEEGFTIKGTLRSRLLRQKKAVAKGRRGEDFHEVARRLGLR